VRADGGEGEGVADIAMAEEVSVGEEGGGGEEERGFDDDI
jgi:hypothetical protein